MPRTSASGRRAMLEQGILYAGSRERGFIPRGRAF